MFIVNNSTLSYHYHSDREMIIHSGCTLEHNEEVERKNITFMQILRDVYKNDYVSRCEMSIFFVTVQKKIQNTANTHVIGSGTIVSRVFPQHTQNLIPTTA